MTLPELTRRSGYSKTTTHRLLTTLVLAGWLERTASGGFRLTIKAFQLGTIVLDGLDLCREASPIMSALSADTGATVYLMVPTGVAATCLERIDPRHAIRVLDVDVGGSQLLHVGAAPRALLAVDERGLLPALLRVGQELSENRSLVDPRQLKADLAAIRQRGYSIVRDDVTVGLGAPVFDSRGRAAAALSVGALIGDFGAAEETGLAGRLLLACGELSTRLGADVS